MSQSLLTAPHMRNAWGHIHITADWTDGISKTLKRVSHAWHTSRYAHPMHWNKQIQKGTVSPSGPNGIGKLSSRYDQNVCFICRSGKLALKSSKNFSLEYSKHACVKSPNTRLHLDLVGDYLATNGIYYALNYVYENIILICRHDSYSLQCKSSVGWLLVCTQRVRITPIALHFPLLNFSFAGTVIQNHSFITLDFNAHTKSLCKRGFL